MKVFTACTFFLSMPKEQHLDRGSQTPTPPDGQKPQRGRMGPHTLMGYAALLGLAMIAAAWLWAGAVRGRDLGAWFPANHWVVATILGGLVGTGFALTVGALLDYLPAFQRIEQMLLSVLDMDALGWHDALLFGLLAGIPEEILFRGAMQPALGWPLTSVLFGAVHALSLAYFVYATGAGAFLGGLAIGGGGLWAPVAAHVAIDTIMFALLIFRWRRTPHGA
jgi:membrane protease YdiL (CAAX protease family)